MPDFLFDTNVLIDHMRGVKEATELIIRVEDGRIRGHISALTEVELFSGKEVEDPHKRELLGELVGLFNRIELSSEIARAAGSIRRKYGTKTADAIIAATAAAIGYRLLTKNIGDFKRIKEIEAEEPY